MERVAYVVAAGFLSRYLCGSLPYNRKIKCVECVVSFFPFFHTQGIIWWEIIWGHLNSPVVQACDKSMVDLKSIPASEPHGFFKRKIFWTLVKLLMLKTVLSVSLNSEKYMNKKMYE